MENSGSSLTRSLSDTARCSQWCQSGNTEVNTTAMQRSCIAHGCRPKVSACMLWICPRYPENSWAIGSAGRCQLGHSQYYFGEFAIVESKRGIYQVDLHQMVALLRRISRTILGTPNGIEALSRITCASGPRLSALDDISHVIRSTPDQESPCSTSGQQAR